MIRMDLVEILNSLRTELVHYINDRIAPYDQRVRVLELDLRKALQENAYLKRDVATLQRAVDVLKVKAAR
jgi:hypothetical protein